jgi:hypothetical protein
MVLHGVFTISVWAFPFCFNEESGLYGYFLFKNILNKYFFISIFNIRYKNIIKKKTLLSKVIPIITKRLLEKFKACLYFFVYLFLCIKNNF